MMVSSSSSPPPPPQIHDSKQFWVGIDIGIKNLGIVKVCINDEFYIDNVIFAEKIDLTRLKHSKVPRSECKLYHSIGNLRLWGRLSR